ncbi:MAG: MBL fold metallo-hydrolase [Acidobacteria bacterium]|nr:MBL fold metallo-hydrolase [Acidobacteriota bacterium]
MARVCTIVTGALLLLGMGSTAEAQVDLTGLWAPLFHEDRPERLPGPAVGDYLGLPINAAARMRADSWSASLLTLPEHQCKPHPAAYGYRGPANLRIQHEVDFDTQQVRRITMYIEWMQQYREIWMDGRPRPGPFAPHAWQGFSTGRWEGDTLVVTTTHMKAGWVRRNGVPYSDLATFTDRWTRHGDYLAHVAILEDPVYLTEPFVRTTNWRAAPDLEIRAYPCEPVKEIADREPGAIPHFLPGRNPHLEEYARTFDLPVEAVRGGADTMLPGLLAAGRAAPLEEGPASRALPPRPVDGVTTVPVQGNVFLIAGAGGNVAVQVGDDGLLVVDTGTGERAPELLRAIEALAHDRPMRWIVNTHADSAHTGGNAAISTSGGVTATDAVPSFDDGSVGAGLPISIVAHDAVLRRMTQGVNGQAPAGFAALPTSTFVDEVKEIYFNGEAIQLLHMPAAHTDGDVLVFFRKSDVIVAGDIFVSTGYPRPEMDRGGSINGVIAALNRLIRLTVPRLNQEGGTYVIPGHGRVADEADVVDYRDMVTIIRDRVQEMVNRGMTLDQVLAARVTRDYDGRFAAADGPGSADAFVESVHRSLQAAR